MLTCTELADTRRPTNVVKGVTNCVMLAPGRGVCDTSTDALAPCKSCGASNRMAAPTPASPATLRMVRLLILR